MTGTKLGRPRKDPNVHRRTANSWGKEQVAAGCCYACGDPRSNRSRMYCDRHLEMNRLRLAISRARTAGDDEAVQRFTAELEAVVSKPAVDEAVGEAAHDPEPPVE